MSDTIKRALLHARRALATGGSSDDDVIYDPMGNVAVPATGGVKPVMDPELMGPAWAAAVRAYKTRDPNEPSLTAASTAPRDEIGATIAGDPNAYGGTFREGAAKLLVGSTGLPGSGMGFGVTDAVPFVGGALNVGDFKHAYDEGDKLGMAGSAAGAAIPFAKPIYGGVKAGLDVARRYAAPAAAGAAAMLAPEDAEASFIGQRAKTTILPALDLAKKFVREAPHAAARDGLADRDAWLQYGWGRDPAGNWKSEISDKNARINEDAANAFRMGFPTKVGDVLHHPELFDAYPSSFSRPLSQAQDMRLNGSYDHMRDNIAVNPALDDYKTLDTLLHELQHRHDMRFEGHQPGGSPEMFPDLAGRYREEVDHLNMTDRIRRAMKETGDDDWTAYRTMKQVYGDEFPSELSFSKFSRIDPDAIAPRQLELADLIKQTPTPFDQYRAMIGEQIARLPGKRLGMSNLARRQDFPLNLKDPIHHPQTADVYPNHNDLAWDHHKNGGPGPEFDDQLRGLEDTISRGAKRSAGGDVIAEVHDHMQHLGGGGEVVNLAQRILGKLHAAGSGYKSVPGKPANVVIPGYGKVEARPIESLGSAADSYMAGLGRAGEHHVSAYPQFNEDLARRYAEAFDALGHNPNDPAVRRAYDALAEETLAQYRSVKDSGLDMRFLKDGEADPYALSPSLGYADIVNNGKLHVFPTDQGYGTSEAFNSPNSPMLKRVGRIGDLDNATVNDAFRVVHDVYGHFAPGNPFFRAPGEERAFINHSQMYSPDALPAMASETRGQNSWVNYGPHAEHNAKASGADTIYADQKADLMPDWATRIPDAGEPGKAEGGEVDDAPPTADELQAVTNEAHATAAANPSLIDQAKSILSQFNPIGTAEANPLDGVIGLARKVAPNVERGALGLIRKPGKPTVAMAEGAEPRFPGIYGDPREIAAEANSRVAPRSDSLPTVFGVNRDELYEMGEGVKGNMEPQLNGAKKPKGSAAVDGIMNKRNEQRLLDILAEGNKYPELQRGMNSWYEMYPLYQAFERIYGPEEAAKQFNMFNHSTGMMSPASEVTTEINRGTAAYALNKQGRFDDFVKLAGQPEWQRGGNYPPDMRHVIAHPYHNTAQAGPLAKFYEKGFIDSKRPKVPLYVQASGVPATGFQTSMPVPDAHFTRALGMADTRWGTAAPDRSMSMAELQAVAPWFRDKIASKSGLESVPAQARLWGLMSGQTGVTSPIGTPKLEMIADHIMDMARRHGISPADARDALIRGEKFADGGDVEEGSIS